MAVGIGIKHKSIYFTPLNSTISCQSTIIKIYPSFIVSLKTSVKNGYQAIVLQKLNASVYINSANDFYKTTYLKEFRVDNILNYKIGQIFNVENFDIAMPLTIKAKTIGKGFTGNIKRNAFKRGPMTHGSKNHRQPGSIGQSTTPGRVFKNKKMAGRCGFTNTTIKNLKILNIDKSNNLLYVGGAIPGKKNNVVFITS